MKICKTSLVFGSAVLAFGMLTSCNDDKEKKNISEVNLNQELEFDLPEGKGEAPVSSETLEKLSKIGIPPLSMEVMKSAQKRQKLVLVVVNSSLWPSNNMLLRALEKGSELREYADNSFELAAIDADVNTEFYAEILSLSHYQKMPLRYPSLVWITPAGHPVSWSNVSELSLSSAQKELRDLFNSLSIVWQKEANYVCRDAKNRNQSRINTASKDVKELKLPDKSLQARWLPSLYDFIGQNFDTSNGPLPADAILATAAIAQNSELSASVRELALEANVGVLNKLLSSVCRDPLTGAFAFSRLGDKWDVFVPCWTASMQAGMTHALIESSKAQKRPELLDFARMSLEWVDASLTATDGGILLGRVYEESLIKQVQAQTWSYEELTKALNADQLKILETVCGVSKIGNIPMSSYLAAFSLTNKNVLGNKISLDEAAKKLGISSAKAKENYMSALVALRGIRPEMNPNLAKLISVETSENFARHLSAWAKLAKASGNPKDKEHAIKLFNQFVGLFISPENRLIHSRVSGQVQLKDARAQDLAVALDAMLDYHDLVGDGKYNALISSLYSQISELKYPNGTYKELSNELSLFALSGTFQFSFIVPATNQLMYENLGRLKKILPGSEIEADLKKLEKFLDVGVQKNPYHFSYYLYAKLKKDA